MQVLQEQSPATIPHIRVGHKKKPPVLPAVLSSMRYLFYLATRSPLDRRCGARTKSSNHKNKQRDAWTESSTTDRWGVKQFPLNKRERIM
jgi:hypothetical protein